VSEIPISTNKPGLMGHDCSASNVRSIDKMIGSLEQKHKNLSERQQNK
jgi:hypothetical protein